MKRKKNPAATISIEIQPNDIIDALSNMPEGEVLDWRSVKSSPLAYAAVHLTRFYRGSQIGMDELVITATNSEVTIHKLSLAGWGRMEHFTVNPRLAAFFTEAMTWRKTSLTAFTTIRAMRRLMEWPTVDGGEIAREFKSYGL